MEKINPNSIITMTKNGPIIVKGSFEIIGVDGRKIELSKAQIEHGVSLCRCGRSHNKPFCDGSHTKLSSTDEFIAK